MSMIRIGALAAMVVGCGSATAQTVMMTHSLDTNFIVGGNSVACAAGAGPQFTAENRYFRSFNLASFGVTMPLTVTNVQFGIENATHPDTTQKVKVIIWRDTNGGAPNNANLVKVGEMEYDVADQVQTKFDAAMSIGTLDPADTLVVEVMTPDYNVAPLPATSAVFFIGSNPLGETGPSYLASTDCGIAEPNTTAQIGFPNMHIVMVVTGEQGAVACYADCDGSGGLDFFDFLCFQNEFAAATAYADCDNSGGHDFFDFLCFQNEFAAGCP